MVKVRLIVLPVTGLVKQIAPGVMGQERKVVVRVLALVKNTDMIMDMTTLMEESTIIIMTGSLAKNVIKQVK
jgi:hypothetical protein